MNSVGKLAQFCQRSKIVAPYYEDIDDVLQGDQTHVFTVRCTVDHINDDIQILTADGKGNKKQLARREAALAVIEKMKELGIDVDNLPEKKSTQLDVDNLAEKKSGQLEFEEKDVAGDWSDEELDGRAENTLGKKLSRVRNELLVRCAELVKQTVNTLQPSNDAVHFLTVLRDQLKTIGIELTATVARMPSKTQHIANEAAVGNAVPQKAKSLCILQFKCLNERFSDIPLFSAHGVGDSARSARISALNKAILLLPAFQLAARDTTVI